MVVGAKGMMEGYPRTAKPGTAQPHVMWPDTPYEHLILPVQRPEAATRYRRRSCRRADAGDTAASPQGIGGGIGS